VGVVLLSESGEKIEEISRFVGIATNNVAEYLAAIYGLQEAIYMKASRVILSLDSQLVARQLKGEYKVKNPDIRKFFDIALNLFRGFDKVEVREISRDENKEADSLVNKAINLQALL
jgi:ribonuclease HI